MKHNTIRTLMACAGATLLVAGSTQAANSFFDPGDLILFFQKPGDTDTVYVSLGNAATLYRGSAAGPTADRQALNIVNISTTLTSAFGSGWASDTSIYSGIVGALSASTSQTLQPINLGDQKRTLYASKPRTDVGTVGLADSVAWDITLGNSSTGGATQIVALGDNLENNTTQRAEVLPTSLSLIDNYNPFLTPGIQGTAFNAFQGGVQQVGGATAFGSFGDAGSVEFALDLYRIVPLNDSDTTGEISGVKQVGSFEGTFTVGTNGQVSFITQLSAVPEPSGALALGLIGTVAGLGYRRRRNA